MQVCENCVCELPASEQYVLNMSNKVSALCGSVALNLCYFPFLANGSNLDLRGCYYKIKRLGYVLAEAHTFYVGHLQMQKMRAHEGSQAAQLDTTGTSSVTRLRADQRWLHKSSRPLLPGPALCFMRDISNIILTYLRKVRKKVLRKCQSPCKWNQVEVRWTGRPELERRVAMSVMISKLKCIVHHETRHPECTSSPNVQYDETKDKQIGTTSTFQ